MNRSDPGRNASMLCGRLAKRGYLRWWHSFSGTSQATGETRTFYIEYFLINPGLTAREQKKSQRPSYVRVSAGMFPGEGSPGCAFYRDYPISAAKYAARPLYFQAGDNILQEGRIQGLLTRFPEEEDPFPQVHVMEWEVELCKVIACHTGLIASPFSVLLNTLDSFWHAEGIRTDYRGTVTIGSEIYDVTPKTSFGYADKHWGRSYNHPWLQLASCNLRSQRTGKLLRNSALALDGCCPRFLCFRLKPRLMLQLTYTGEDFCFSFARPSLLSRVKWGTKETVGRFRWRILAQNRSAVVKIQLHSQKQDMLTLSYEDPAGEEAPVRSSYPLWTGGSGTGSIELYRITPAGREWLDTLSVEHSLCQFRRPPRKSVRRRQHS